MDCRFRGSDIQGELRWHSAAGFLLPQQADGSPFRAAQVLPENGKSRAESFAYSLKEHFDVMVGHFMGYICSYTGRTHAPRGDFGDGP